MTEEEFRAAIAEERRHSRAAGAAFGDACRRGDVEALLAAADGLGERTVDGWRFAMMRAAELPGVSEEIRAAFLNIWIESKHLPLVVGDRRIMAKALRVLMPGPPAAAPMRLYRGTTALERRRRLYGFSWTPRLEIARDKFADMRRGAPGGAVVLETVAPPEAIMLVRDDEGYYDEGEVIVDPYKLGRVKLVERLG